MNGHSTRVAILFGDNHFFLYSFGLAVGWWMSNLFFTAVLSVPVALGYSWP